MDVFVAKWESNGALAWAKTLGDAVTDDTGYSITPTLDGMLAMAGSTQSFGAEGTDAWVAKMTLEGETANCAYLYTITPTVFDITRQVTTTTLSLTPKNWAVIPQDWNIPDRAINLTMRQQCPQPITPILPTQPSAIPIGVVVGKALDDAAILGIGILGVGILGTGIGGAIWFFKKRQETKKFQVAEVRQSVELGKN